jgi:hypothetical protein
MRSTNELASFVKWTNQKLRSPVFVKAFRQNRQPRQYYKMECDPHSQTRGREERMKIESLSKSWLKALFNDGRARAFLYKNLYFLFKMFWVKASARQD